MSEDFKDWRLFLQEKFKTLDTSLKHIEEKIDNKIEKVERRVTDLEIHKAINKSEARWNGFVAGLVINIIFEVIIRLIDK